MKIFLRVVLALFILAALGAAGWVGRVLWNENRRLLAEKAAVDVERLRFATGKDAAESELKAVMLDREQLRHDLLTARAALEKAEVEKVLLEKQLVDERKKARENLENVSMEKSAAARAVVQKRKPGDPLENVGSLKDLLDLTDKAPRRAK